MTPFPRTETAEELALLLRAVLHRTGPVWVELDDLEAARGLTLTTVDVANVPGAVPRFRLEAHPADPRRAAIVRAIEAEASLMHPGNRANLVDAILEELDR